MENGRTRLLRTRVEVPQYDFSGLPQLPNTSSYSKRMQGIKVLGPCSFTIHNQKLFNANREEKNMMIYRLTESSLAHQRAMMEHHFTLPELFGREFGSRSQTPLPKRTTKTLDKELIVSFCFLFTINLLAQINPC